ncbi:GntR family transcriptional regulator [Pararobbsia alpina]|uniref:HTH-type transcriptional repressor RspR n=1 Tax=Pararobbsia alpina TaxID=621374 RepID=A0A6S7C3Z8_9BURK|nr:GntR family transcriptional regulator [Pararobbsia alpina]CAB3800878.1 HTH-type transcriptional repressor RspR [Pararobbsia alpina]
MAESEDLIYQALSKALLAGELAPGTQLVETRVASLFGVSRERVRKALHRLGHERLIEVIPHRGAFVSAPTLSQAREIYEARRIIEGGVTARLAGRLTPSQIQQLRAHAQREARAFTEGDRASLIQLSRQFHLLLGQFCGNAFVVRELEELVSRTSMLEAFFEPENASQCACDEHREIVDALEKGDATRAISTMHTHLSVIETQLRTEPSDTRAFDADAALAKAWAALTPRACP